MKLFIMIFGLVLLVPPSLMAQGAAVSGGAGVPLYLPDLAYGSSYAPVFLYGTQGSGLGTQVLTLDRSFQPSVWGAVEWFPSAHAGLLVRGSFGRAPLGGANTPYSVSMDYTSRQPPDYVERQYHYDRSSPWPDTTGHLDTWAFDVEATLGSTAVSGARVHFDGGLSLVGSSGTFEPVGLTTFQLGGHAVLFPNEYQLALGIDRTWAATAVVSGGVTLPLGGHVGIEVSGRVLVPRTVAANVHVLSVGGDTAVAALSVEEAQTALAPRPMSLKLASMELLVGVRVGI